MSRLTISQTPLEGLFILQRQPVSDTRGYFERLFCETDLRDLLQGKSISQINHSFTTTQGIVRGMHYQQPPYAEKKVISCLRGKVFDVAVDIRTGSPTFLKWYSEVLSQENHRALFIPEGFAHGFQTLTDNCTLVYLHTAPYEQKSEAALNACDERLSIDWPMAITSRSERDVNHPMLPDTFEGITV